MLNTLRWIMLNMVVFFLVSASFILLVRTIDIPDLPLFYRGIVLLSIIFVFFFFVAIAARWWFDSGRGRGKGFSFESFFSALILALSLNLVFFVIVPVTIDRSVTTFLLASMASSNGEPARFTKNELQRLLERDYLRRFDAVGRRLEEQVVSGNVEQIGPDSYVLTEQGESFLRFARGVASLYRIPPRYIDVADLRSSN